MTTHHRHSYVHDVTLNAPFGHFLFIYGPMVLETLPFRYGGSMYDILPNQIL